MNFSQRPILSFIISLTLLIGLTNNAGAAGKIGFVDMESLIDNSPQISQARASISSEFENQYENIEQKTADLEILENRLTKGGAMMTLEELKNVQERARILERQIRRAKEDLKDAISVRNTIVLNRIQKEIQAVVKNYAITNGYDAIFINSILYVNDEMDITKEILQVLKNNQKQ